MNKLFTRAAVLAALLLLLAAPAAAQDSKQYVRERTGIPSVCPPGTLTINRATGIVYGNTLGVCSVVGTFTGGTVASPILGPNGTAAAPTYSFSNATNLGVYARSTAALSFSSQGTGRMEIEAANVGLASDVALHWKSGALGTGADTILVRDAANTLALHNSTNAQTFRVYNTYTDASNNERGSLGYVSNVLTLAAENAGTGSARSITIKAGGSNGTTFSDSGVSQGLINRNGFAVGATSQFLFTGTANNATVSADSGIARDAAGKLRVSNGTTGYGTISGAAAFLYKTSAQSIATATWTSVTWDAELDDTNTFHDNVTNNSRITVNATTAGKLTFTCNVGVDVSSVGLRSIRLYKNGTTIVFGPFNFLPNTTDPATMSMVVDVPDAANGDYFECQVFQSAGGSLNSTSGRVQAHFSVRSY